MTAHLHYDLTRESSRLRMLVPIFLAAQVVYLIHAGVYAWFIQQLETGALTEIEVDRAGYVIDILGGFMGIGLILAFVACVVVSGMWIYRAAANAAVLCPSTDRITPGWAVGWFFIPVANLWMPFWAVRQIFNSSMQPPSLNDPAPERMSGWWALWIISNLCDRASVRLDMRAETLADFSRANYLGMAGTLMSIGAAILWLRLVTEITHAQEAAAPPKQDMEGDANDET